MWSSGAHIVLLALSWLLAAILGFAAHRASLCTVRAVAELMSSGRAYCLMSFAKAVLWVLAIKLPVLAIKPEFVSRIGGVPFSWATMLGGLLFGMGAALNGGCSFSTLSRLADGQLRMLLTLMGFVAGAVMQAKIISAVQWSHLPPTVTTLSAVAPFAGMLSFIIWLWAAYEFSTLWLTRPRKVGIAGLALARQYRLSTAAAIIGIASGGLYLIYGSWTYTALLRQTPRWLALDDGALLLERVLLLVAVILGMVLSTVQRGSFRLDWRVRGSWFLNLGGGLLMGSGAVLVPGGNDALLLYGIPTLSAHAAPAYLAMLTGVAIVLAGMRFLTGKKMNVCCDGDICRSN